MQQPVQHCNIAGSVMMKLFNIMLLDTVVIYQFTDPYRSLCEVDNVLDLPSVIT